VAQRIAQSWNTRHRAYPGSKGPARPKGDGTLCALFYP
jgi:hypothetical protein